MGVKNQKKKFEKEYFGIHIDLYIYIYIDLSVRVFWWVALGV